MTTVSYPTAPAVTPLKGSLLQTASVDENFPWQTGFDLFESYNCMKFGESAEFCADNDKDLDQSAGFVDGFRFAAYGGVTCKTIGLDRGEMLSETERVFRTGESTAVERALMAQRFRANADANHGWPAPVDLTPVGGAVRPAVGVALLEGYASSVYVGVPTLHLPITIASLLLAVDGMAYVGDHLFTKTGSKVVAGAGYDFPNTGPTGANAAAGEKWLYATGEVYVARSAEISQQAINFETNEVTVLAERGYIVAVDCFTAAVRVTVA